MGALLVDSRRVHPIEARWRRDKLAIPIPDRLDLIYAVHCCIVTLQGPVVTVGHLDDNINTSRPSGSMAADGSHALSLKVMRLSVSVIRSP